MRVRLLLGMATLTLLVTAFAPVPPPKDPAKTPAGMARKLLEGTWVVKFTETPADPPPGMPAFRIGSRITIDGERWSSNDRAGKFDAPRGRPKFQGGGSDERGGKRGKEKEKRFSTELLLVVNPAKQPTRIELKQRDTNRVYLRGVYQLEGNTLRLSLVPGRADVPNPESVVPRPEGATLLILERIRSGT